MLLLTMKEQDYVLLGSNVKISVERIDDRDRIFVGIDAPKDVVITRGQVYEREIAEQAALTGDKVLMKLSKELAEKRAKAEVRYASRQKTRREKDAQNHAKAGAAQAQ